MQARVVICSVVLSGSNITALKKILFKKMEKKAGSDLGSTDGRFRSGSWQRRRRVEGESNSAFIVIISPEKKADKNKKGHGRKHLCVDGMFRSGSWQRRRRVKV